jgi:hypothetical protein
MWTPDNIIFASIFGLAFTYLVISKIADTILRIVEIRGYFKLTQHPVIIARQYDDEETEEDDSDLLRDQINNLDI